MITSSSNSQIKNVIQLRKKPKERSIQDLFLVEGPKMFLEVPKKALIKAYLSESFYKKNGKDPRVQNVLEQAPSEVVSDSVFEALSDTKTPQGVICLVRQFHYKEEDLLHGVTSGSSENSEKKNAPMVMVLENLQDPGNLGTILRTGEGAGVSGILLSQGCVDLYNPKVIRSTMGSIYRMPFLYTEQLGDTLNRWKATGVQICAAHLKGKLSYDEEDYRKPTAFLIGNESKGLTEETSAIADHLIRIPMLGQVESLNAAVAGSILMYEAARQRRQG